MFTLSTIVFLGAISMVTGLAALAMVIWLAPTPRQGNRHNPQDVLAEPRRFTFRDGYLIEVTGGAGFLIPTPINHLTAWDSLQDSLIEVLENVPEAFSGLREEGRAFQLSGAYGRDTLTVIGVRDGDELIITVAAAGAEQHSVRLDRRSVVSLQADNDMLHSAIETSPILSWAINQQGEVIWGNAAYIACIQSVTGPDSGIGWPLPALFADETTKTPGTVRRKLVAMDDTVRWFELSVVKSSDALRFVHATPLDKVIKAEDALRTFIHTLTKTFAHLPTGLAIFDRDRQLALFNPALIDLTELDGGWLSQRPTLESFFDRLRERQKLPEPKDYKAWRESLSAVERATDSGTYEETWNLPTGQIYRVTGRPHPDGAVALLIEDISAEMSITRRFRSTLEVYQAVLDTSQEALAVFDANGQISMSNDRYAQMWGHDPRNALTTISATEALQTWQAACLPNPLWGEVRDFLTTTDDRAEWFDDVICTDGSQLQVRVSPLARGGTLVGFMAGTATLQISDASTAAQ